MSPIHINNETVSLSAILLDDEYYHLLVSSATIVEGISVLNLKSLIVFKIKAWLDLSARKLNGEKIDTRNIKKHKNDVLRLAVNISPTAKLELSSQIKNDVEKFLSIAKSEPVRLKDIGIRAGSYQDLLDRIGTCFL